MRLIALILLTPLFTMSQALSPGRVKKIKSATVRIFIEDTAVGTGFFIDESGKLLTCWHVIKNAVSRDPSTDSIAISKKITIQNENNDVIEYRIGPEQFKDVTAFQNSQVYDFCTLYPVNLQEKKIPFLRLGKFTTVNEGEQVYTCGYPFGMGKQFLSHGMVSTIYRNDKTGYKNNRGKIFKMPRNEVLIDMTMNRGNSGGPIVRIGDRPENDIVIGIATFIIAPSGQLTDEFIEYLKKGVNANISVPGFSYNDLMAHMSELLTANSVGISGCISIDHYSDENKRRESFVAP